MLEQPKKIDLNKANPRVYRANQFTGDELIVPKVAGVFVCRDVLRT